MISLRNITFEYETSAPVIRSGDLDIEHGLTLVLGPNGCGKSTLMKIVAGVEKPDEGTVLVDGLDLWTQEVESRRLISYVPEHPDLTPYATIEEVLLLVCRLRQVPLDEALDAARRAGVDSYRRHSIRELSQGQRRRVLMAAAWIGSPRVLVLDEPLEAMDRTMRRDILSWVGQNVELRHTVLLSTHAVDDFAERASAVVTVREGRLERWDALPDDGASRRSFLADIAAGSEVQA